jgi:hypothetical protein
MRRYPGARWLSCTKGLQIPWLRCRRLLSEGYMAQRGTVILTYGANVSLEALSDYVEEAAPESRSVVLITDKMWRGKWELWMRESPRFWRENSLSISAWPAQPVDRGLVTGRRYFSHNPPSPYSDSGVCTPQGG